MVLEAAKICFSRIIIKMLWAEPVSNMDVLRKWIKESTLFISIRKLTVEISGTTYEIIWLEFSDTNKNPWKQIK